MSTDHRGPMVAFVVLAFLAAAVVGIHRADADDARFMASVLGSTGQVDGRIPTDELADQRADGDLLEVPRGWFVAVEERSLAGQDASPSEVRDRQAATATRGQDGRKGRPAVRQRGSSRPAAKAATRRAGSHPRHAPERRGTLAAAEKAAEQALRSVTRRQRSHSDRDTDRSSGRDGRIVGRTADTAGLESAG